MQQEHTRRAKVAGKRLRTRARRLAAGSALTIAGVAAAGELAAASAQDATGYRDAVLAEPGLVSYWRAAEARGASPARDAEGANHGRYRNGPRLGVPGLVATDADTAARYDGGDDHVSVPDSATLDLRSTFTLEAWVKPLSIRRHATIMRKHNAYFLKAERSDVRVAFWDQAGRLRNLVATGQLQAGRTHHLVATYGSATMRLYVDARLVRTAMVPSGTAAAANGNPLTIGNHRGEAFHGVIDEAAVYEAPLTAGEVADHHRSATGDVVAAPPEPASGPAPGAGASAGNPPPAPAPSSPAPFGSVLWNGDFETGDLRQYDAVQGVAPDRITLTSAPLRKGRFATKMTALDGDTEISGNPRAQLMSASQHFPGQEHFVGWSTLFPADFPAIQGSGAFMVFFQFHGKPWSGSPPLGWGVAPDGRIELRRNQQYGYDRVWSMPLEKSRWVNFVARVKWSKNASEGFVELWVDGVPQRFSNGQPRLTMQTVMNDQNEGLKTIPTNYRRKGIVPGAVTLYQDEVKVGTTYQAVAP